MNTQKSPKTVQEFQDQFKLIIGLCHKLHKYKDVYYALCEEANRNSHLRKKLDIAWAMISQRDPCTKAKGLSLLMEICQCRMEMCVGKDDYSFKTIMIEKTTNKTDIRNKFAAIIEEQLKNPEHKSLKKAMGRKDVDHKTIMQNIPLFTVKPMLLQEMKEHVKKLTKGQTTLLEDLLWDYCYKRGYARAFAYTMLRGDIWRFEEEVTKCMEDDNHPTPPIPYVLQFIFCRELVTEKNHVYDEIMEPYYQFEERRKQEAEAEKKQAEERRRREETARLTMEEENRVQQEDRAREAIESEVAAMEESMKTLRLAFPHMPEIDLQRLAAMHMSCKK